MAETTVKYDLLFYIPLFVAYFSPTYLIPSIIDSFCAAMLCFANIQEAFSDGKTAIFELLDRALDESNQLIIVQYLAKHFDSYTVYHGQQTRKTADLKYITLFLEFDPNKTMNEIFKDTKALESDLEKSILGAKVCIVPTDEKIIHDLPHSGNK